MKTTTEEKPYLTAPSIQPPSPQGNHAVLKALETMEHRIEQFRESAGSSYCLMHAIEGLLRQLKSQVNRLKCLISDGGANSRAGLPEDNGQNVEELVASVLRYPDAQLRRKIEALQAALHDGSSQDRAAARIVSA